jgi:hypothetical protein
MDVAVRSDFDTDQGKTPSLAAGFFVEFSQSKNESKKGGKFPPFVSPMTVMPVTMVPAMMMPAVVTPVAVVPVMVMPAHLHGLHLIDFVLRDDRRLNVYHSRHGRHVARDRRYGSRLCARSQQDRARDQSSTEIQEIPKFHHFKPLS